MNARPQKMIDETKEQLLTVLSPSIGDFNTYNVCLGLKLCVEEQIREYMKKYPVPYEVEVSVSPDSHILNCTVTLPAEYITYKRECQCSHNERCDLCKDKRHE